MDEQASRAQAENNNPSNSGNGIATTVGQGSQALTFVANTLDLEKKQAEDKVPITKIFKLYVLPIATILSFSGIVVLLVLPALNAMFSSLDEISLLGQQARDLDAEIASLQNLEDKSFQITADLGYIDTVVSTGLTEITLFQQKIIDLAKNNGLTVSEANTVEQVLKTGEQDIVALGIIEIPNNFSLSGSLEDIKVFIQQIQSVNDLVIVGEMELKADPIESDRWDLSILLVKYQFQQPNENNDLLQAYDRVRLPLNQTQRY